MKFNRRSILRGGVQGAAVGVALPLLDCFLDGNGTALADGAKLPTRFGTYFWGLGLTPGRWVPTKTGADWDVTPELSSLAPLKQKVSVFSGFRILLDGKPNLVHWTGQAAILTGQAPAKTKSFDRLPSFDTKVASLEALDAVRNIPDRVCPLVCERGERAAGDHCVEISCASGYVLNSRGSCEKHHESFRRQRTVSREFTSRRRAPYLAVSPAPAAPHNGSQPCTLDTGGHREGGGWRCRD